MAALAESIRQLGVQQPILARPVNGHHEIVYGHRRYAAALAAGLAEIPATVRQMSDLDAATAQAVENLQREDLTPLEEARGYATLRDQHGQKPEEIAAAVGKSPALVRARLQLLKCAPEVQQALADGKIGADVATRLAVLTPAVQTDAVAAKSATEVPMPRRRASTNARQKRLPPPKKSTAARAIAATIIVLVDGWRVTVAGGRVSVARA